MVTASSLVVIISLTLEICAVSVLSAHDCHAAMASDTRSLQTGYWPNLRSVAVKRHELRHNSGNYQQKWPR
jgi:hypothetical protein